MKNSQSNPNINNIISNKYLLNDDLNANDLKTYLRLRFRDYKEAGIKAGISQGRVRQILVGYDLPKTAKLIYQIAEGWSINPVKLTLCFENIDNFNRINKSSEDEKGVENDN
ncbi:hypothetical protein HOE04_02130 [archaeon]|jgi:hypothetical protein|nr:hypothetical protein [archaeon]